MEAAGGEVASGGRHVRSDDGEQTAARLVGDLNDLDADTSDVSPLDEPVHRVVVSVAAEQGCVEELGRIEVGGADDREQAVDVHDVISLLVALRQR